MGLPELEEYGFGSASGPVAGSYEHSTKLLGSIKVGKFLSG
jgi:hypothetical protein